MILNPELQRNIWLEFNPQRLVMMPAILLLMFGTIWITIGQRWFATMDVAAILLFFILTGFWGGKRAMDAIAEEVQQHTWENQVLSTLTPWTLTWGKLLGTTLYTWYGGVICLVIWAMNALQQFNVTEVIKVLLALVLAALLVQSLAFVLGLLFIRKGVRIGTRRSNLIFLAVMLIFIGIFPFSGSELALQHVRVVWHGTSLAALDFLVLSLALWSCWMLTGCYRLMRSELMYRNGPWVWWGFLACILVYINGFDRLSLGDEWLGTAVDSSVKSFLIILLISYFMLINEPKDFVIFRRLRLSLDRGALQFLNHLPCWALSVPVLLGYAGILLAQLSGQDAILSSWFSPTFALGVCLFFLRDAALFVYLNQSLPKGKADTTALIYLFVLYLVIPILLGRLDQSGWIMSLFVPSPLQSTFQNLVPPLIELALLVMLLLSKRNRLPSPVPTG